MQTPNVLPSTSTQDEREARELRLYGVTIEEMKQQFSDALFCGPKMLVISQLSDAQEEIAHGMQEHARQTINRAKWLVMELLNEPTPWKV